MLMPGSFFDTPSFFPSANFFLTLPNFFLSPVSRPPYPRPINFPPLTFSNFPVALQIFHRHFPDFPADPYFVRRRSRRTRRRSRQTRRRSRLTRRRSRRTRSLAADAARSQRAAPRSRAPRARYARPSVRAVAPRSSRLSPLLACRSYAPPPSLAPSRLAPLRRLVGRVSARRGAA